MWSLTDRNLLTSSDLTFFEQTLTFALRENDETRGLNMIRLLENLMAPWNENKGWIEDGAEVVPINVRCIVPDSKMLTNLMIVVGNIGYLTFFATGVFVVLRLVVVVYHKIRKIWYCHR